MIESVLSLKNLMTLTMKRRRLLPFSANPSYQPSYQPFEKQSAFTFTSSPFPLLPSSFANSFAPSPYSGLVLSTLVILDTIPPHFQFVLAISILITQFKSTFTVGFK
jgi:hypothetical protein